MGVPLTYQLSQNQKRAANEARATQFNENHGATTIEAQDSGKEAGYVIYVYNILQRRHFIEQPPLFPGFEIPACEPGKEFSFTQLPAFVKEPYFKPGTTEMYYKNVDGRKAATSLLNPSAFPGTSWDSQLQNWNAGDQYNNNLNELGVWWSLTRPDEPARLSKEIAIFKERVGRTMNKLIREAETFAASGKLDMITPLQHFAMDYLQKQASWHMTTSHMITCPSCGDPVKDGIAYHRNAFGEKCIVNVERYREMVAQQKQLDEEVAKPAKKKTFTAPETESVAAST